MAVHFLTTAPAKLNRVLSATETGTHHRVHLIVSGDVFMESPQHDHGYHSRQEQNNHQRVHYAGEKKKQQSQISQYFDVDCL